MDKFKLYQEAIAHSVELLNNADAQLRNYVKKVADMRANNVAERVIGRNYTLSDLMAKSDWNFKYYEDVPYKAILVEPKIEYCFLEGALDYNFRAYSLVSLCIYFLRDPETILKSKIKLTDKERKLLNELIPHYKVKQGSRRDNAGSMRDIDKTCNQLETLKHGLHMCISLEWKSTLDDILRDNYLTRGIKAQVPLFTGSML